jgi:manganese/iron transport system permease protein
MGVVFAGLFGLGLTLYASVPTTLHLSHLLFGDMLGGTWGDVAQAGGIALVIVLALLLARADLTAQIFDPLHARAIGLRVRVLHYGLLALIALAVVGALQAVGIILAIALLITPGAIAFLWVRRLPPMLVLASAISVGSALAGVYASFWIDSAPAPTIVLVLTLLFLASLAATRRRPSAATPGAQTHPDPHR